MNRSLTLTACVTVLVALAVYFVPLAVMAVCIDLGWHA